jgi:hypothetical protein
MNKIEDYGLKAVTLAGEGKQLLMAAVFALHTGKAVVEIAAVQIAVNDIREIRKEIFHEECIDFTRLYASAILSAGEYEDLKRGVKMSPAAIENCTAIEKLRQWVICKDSSGGGRLHRFDLLLERAGLT